MIFTGHVIYHNRFLLGVGTRNVGVAPTFYFGKNRVVQTVNVEERIRMLAERVVQTGDLELVHVELGTSGRKKIVRIFIDHPGGITHDQCASVSSGIEKLLDDDDPFKGEYVLEVSSPGIERGLYSASDFEKFVGHNARLKTYEPINGQRNFRGTIGAVVGETIDFEDRTSGMLKIEFGHIKRANLEFDFEKELKAARRGTNSK